MTRLRVCAVFAVGLASPSMAQDQAVRLFGQQFSLPVPASMHQFASPTMEQADTRAFVDTSKKPNPDLIFISLTRKGASRFEFSTKCHAGVIVAGGVVNGVNTLRCRKSGLGRPESTSVQSFVRCLRTETCLLDFTYIGDADDPSSSRRADELVQGAQAYMRTIAVPRRS